MDEEKSFDPKQFITGFFAGMTRAQIGILAGMAGFLIIVMCVGGWFVLRGIGAGTGLSETVQTPTIAPTVTPIVAAPPTTTPTPVLTAIPYEQLIPAGWKQFKTSLVEIWLPTNFILADKKVINQTAQLAFTELFITEIPSKTSTYNMLVSVSYDLMSGDSLDEFLETELKQLPADVRVTDRRTVYVNAVEARRIMIEIRASNIDINDMVYVFLDGDTVWYVEYFAQIVEFFENKDVFEQSVKTFRPVKY